LLKLLELHAHALHEPGALAALVGRPFLGVDNEDAHPRLLGRDLLDEGLWRRCLLARRDTDRTFDPRAGCALDVVEHLAAAAAIAADDIVVALFAHESKVTARHHAAIADGHHTLEPEALLKVTGHLGDRLGIAPIAVKDMVSDPPAIDYNEADEHPAKCAAYRPGCGHWRLSRAALGPRNRSRSDRNLAKIKHRSKENQPLSVHNPAKTGFVNPSCAARTPWPDPARYPI
jgi:hypothetical protein